MNINNPKEVYNTMENDKDLERFPEYMENIANIGGRQGNAIAFGLTTFFQVNKRLINSLEKSNKSAIFLARVGIGATIVLSGVGIRITLFLSK